VNAVLVDSNILLDVATDDPVWGARSAAALAAHAERSVLLINPLIYAEVSVGFDRIEDVEAALPLDLYRREPVPFEAAFLAGKAFLAYRRRGGDKRSPLPDFFIGGHAAVGGYLLLTRDAARYRTYFPQLVVVEP
jgi:predicted nucleic acid-binding protein